MNKRRRWIEKSKGRFAAVAGLAAIVASAGAAALGTGQSFLTLETGFEQELYGVTQLPEDDIGAPYVLGGVAFAPDGDPWVSECVFYGTRLHRFDAQSTLATPYVGASPVHPEAVVQTQGGCGLTNHPDGFLYSNSGDGLYRLDAETGLPVTWPFPETTPPDPRGPSGARGEPGNALGVTVDPLTNHLVYTGAGCHPTFDPAATTCTIHSLDLTDGSVESFAVLSHADVQFVDGIYFDPTGTHLFMANRGSTTGSYAVTILRRPEQSAPFTGLPQIVQSVAAPAEPDGIAFHAASPRFIVTNDEQGGTMTKFTFPGDDYTQTPTITQFASGGFRGDLLQVGADGCIYATQGRNALSTDFATRYDDPDRTETTEDSLVRICGGAGFVPPPGVLETVNPCTASIGNYVWSDLDRDGIQDVNEPGIANATLALEDANGTVVATTTSSASGAYELTAPCGKTYTVKIVTPAGYASTIAGAGADTTLDSNGSPASVTLAATATPDHTIDFGFVSGQISGYAYGDVNKNGMLDTGEPGLNGISIELAGVSTGNAATVGNGAYSFGSLLAGAYSVGAPASADGLTRSTPSPLAVTLVAGEHRPNVNFGYQDLAKPVCVVNNSAGTMTFQDTGSGITSLKITKNLNNNFRVTMPTLAPGPHPAGTTVTFNPPSTASLVVSATRINTKAAAQLIVSATDVYGNVISCDPVITEVTKLRHERGNQTFTDLPQVEHIVTIENDKPGLNGLDIIVNGVEFRVRKLKNNQTRVVDVASAMRPGDDNTITLIPRGKRGDSATVTISDR